MHIRPVEGVAGPAPGVKHCPARAREPAPKSAVDSLPVALSAALRCLSFEHRVVVVDSVLNRELLHPAEVRAIIGQLHGHNRALLDAIDPAAQSGTETMVRLRLRQLGLSLRSQVEIPPVGWVDFVVGERLVIEVDSLEYHTSLENYHNDRRRDRQLVAMGYLVIRLTYHQVITGNWAEVEQDILSVVARGDHLWRNRRRGTSR